MKPFKTIKKKQLGSTRNRGVAAQNRQGLARLGEKSDQNKRKGRPVSFIPADNDGRSSIVVALAREGSDRR